MKIKLLVALCTMGLLVACGNGSSEQKTGETPKIVSAEAASGEVAPEANAENNGENSKARQEAFGAMANEWKSIVATIKGETPYDTADFKANVAAFAEKSTEPFKHFQNDGDGLNGAAKSEIWTDASGFKAEEDKFKAAVAKFNQSAATATDLNALKADFGAVGASCGSCHKAFKSDK